MREDGIGNIKLAVIHIYIMVKLKSMGQVVFKTTCEGMNRTMDSLDVPWSVWESEKSIRILFYLYTYLIKL